MSYKRVIPRDLFNEANLLKCYGQLWLKLEGRLGDTLTLDFDPYYGEGKPFDIEQRHEDGATYLHNVVLLAHDRRIALWRPLNSRDPWPLWALHPDDVDGDEVEVFTEDGELTADFLAIIGRQSDD